MTNTISYSVMKATGDIESGVLEKPSSSSNSVETGESESEIIEKPSSAVKIIYKIETGNDDAVVDEDFQGGESLDFTTAISTRDRGATRGYCASSSKVNIDEATSKTLSTRQLSQSSHSRRRESRSSNSLSALSDGSETRLSVGNSVCNSEAASIVMNMDKSILRLLDSDRRLRTQLEEEGSQYNDENPHGRKTPLCFKCCCDVRQATVIVDICFIVMMVVQAVASLFDSLRDNTFFSVDLNPSDRAIYTDIDDEAIMEHYREEFTLAKFDRTGIITLSLMGAGVLFALVGILGSTRYNKYLVLVTTVWYIFYIVACGIGKQFVGVVVFGFFCYPHLALWFALQRGTLTRENYVETEKYCCFDGSSEED